MSPDQYGAPRENFSRGLSEVDIPELGERQQGKVRDIWRLPDGRRVMVTTDRLSAYDRRICTVPGKGQVLNLLSAFWFEQTADIISNHVIAVPHPNVLIAHEAVQTLPVEVVLRRYMARSSTSTSISRNYDDLERRVIYGVKFPDGLVTNQEFPMGTILTPTTKTESGHDLELTDEEARTIVDSRLGNGTWQRAKEAAMTVFERGREHCLSHGLILVDTKYEIGIGQDGEPMLIDELHTPDSSRFWRAASYQERFNNGQDPESFDKEIIRRWLAKNRFTGEGMVPLVPRELINQVAEAYRVPYRMITGSELPIAAANPEEIRQTTLGYLREHSLIR